MTFCGGYIGGGGETMLLNHQLSPDNKFSICPIGDEGPSPMAMEQAVMNYGGRAPGEMERRHAARRPVRGSLDEGWHL